MKFEDPADLVQRQLNAYNAKDVEAWLSTYAPHAEQFTLHGARLAAGHEALRSRIRLRFSEPDLRAHLLSRVVMNDFVIDLEEVTCNFPEGKGTIRMLCIYEVRNGRISKASFALGKQVLGCA